MSASPRSTPFRPGPGAPPNRKPRPPFALVLGGLAATAVALAAIRLAGASGRGDGAAAVPRGRGLASPTPIAPPRCSNGDFLAPFSEYAGWDRTFLDTAYGLLPDYAPRDLVPVSRAGFEGGFRVRAVVVKDLAALRDAAAAAGHPVAVEAAYRSYAQQVSLIRRRKGQPGGAGALSRTARPGHSEHQLGTTIDFKTRGMEDVTQGWGATATGRWMEENAWRFGFVLSYPRAKVALTCYAYEPWHFRYLGRGMAARIHASGLTERQFLWDLEERSTG